MNLVRKPLPLYETDGHAWYLEQARLLREGRLAEADLAHIAEELEDMGRAERHKLYASLRLILSHLLTWAHQPQRRSRSWTITIVRERLNLARRLEENPSLRPTLDAELRRAYADARKEAAAQTGLPAATFPEDCPFTLEEVTRDGWMPEVQG